ncbi:phosphotransferase family protein [Haliea sp. E1-2-M8]|uniref:phosphotransferase family protein n=1 Tax=Haliea sp. E1-2-M8 TaxID=3064706 RepID=UPI0027227038|nr:phosphotransferase family protein [Haliea sp. E1-2-M8]MDO8862850.1 phosphotransferase family protein [Haliea sp. E1-2-M8]
MNSEPAGSGESAVSATTLAAALSANGASGAESITGLRRLSGGANMETWAFDLENAGSSRPLILRRSPLGSAVAEPDSPLSQLPLTAEAALLPLAAEQGVPVPSVLRVLAPDEPLGPGYIMSRERGEALPGRILADDRYSSARRHLARQCGETLARIHRVSPAQLPTEVPNQTLQQRLAQQQALLDRYGNDSPVHQLALNWLADNAPAPSRHCLLHGDFRNGNLLVDEQGLVAVLDWELAHCGDPAEDLGYLCGNVWRFGRADKPVGGFGEYRDLLAGYHAVAGWAPDMATLRYWEVFCALGWGLVCLTMIDLYRSGADPTLERAAVGRRVSESEMDLLLLLEE